MKYLVTGKEMKLLDQNTSAYFKVPELVLMEQAAMNFVWRLCDVLKEQNINKNAKGIVFCGLGNNGADGTAIARLLNEKGIYTDREYAKPITIEDDCWICGNVTIVGGVKIGKGTIIGAGSVVTKDIPSEVIAAGNPCKVIRKITENDSIYLKKHLF